MNIKQATKWERTRNRGMWRFVLFWVLVTGGTMIAVMTLFDRLVDGSWPGTRSMSIRVPILLISSLAGGVALWFVGERMYRKSSESTVAIDQKDN